MSSCIDDDHSPVVATAVAADEHTYVVTIAAVRATSTGAALCAQYLPVLAMQPSRANVAGARCRSAGGVDVCCAATLIDPSSGRHAVVNVCVFTDRCADRG